jgi:D-glycero-D-manno-heptose 1,7-bisphosphate phosphatase
MTDAGASIPAVILDRDGTIVFDRGYLADPDGLEFLPRAAEGLRLLTAQGYRLVVVTNQSGVGRGLFPARCVPAMNARLEAMVREAGARLDGIYWCPHAPEEHCACRKPAQGLMLQAARDLGFDPAAAVVIGDKESDMEFGRRAGAATIRIEPAGLVPHAPERDAPERDAPERDAPERDARYRGVEGVVPDAVAADLVTAARLVPTLRSPRAGGASR